MATAAIWVEAGFRSLITGPWRVSRTVKTVSGWPRTTIRSSRVAVMASGGSR